MADNVAILALGAKFIGNAQEFINDATKFKNQVEKSVDDISISAILDQKDIKAQIKQLSKMLNGELSNIDTSNYMKDFMKLFDGSIKDAKEFSGVLNGIYSQIERISKLPKEVISISGDLKPGQMEKILKEYDNYLAELEKRQERISYLEKRRNDINNISNKTVKSNVTRTRSKLSSYADYIASGSDAQVTKLLKDFHLQDDAKETVREYSQLIQVFKSLTQESEKFAASTSSEDAEKNAKIIQQMVQVKRQIMSAKSQLVSIGGTNLDSMLPSNYGSIDVDRAVFQATNQIVVNGSKEIKDNADKIMNQILSMAQNFFNQNVDSNYEKAQKRATGLNRKVAKTSEIDSRQESINQDVLPGTQKVNDDIKSAREESELWLKTAKQLDDEFADISKFAVSGKDAFEELNSLFKKNGELRKGAEENFVGYASRLEALYTKGMNDGYELTDDQRDLLDKLSYDDSSNIFNEDFEGAQDDALALLEKQIPLVTELRQEQEKLNEAKREEVNIEQHSPTSNENNVLSVEGQAQVQQEVTTAIEKSVEAEKELIQQANLAQEALDRDFSTKNKTEAFNQVKIAFDEFKSYIEISGDEGFSQAGTIAAYNYIKAFQEAVNKGVAESKLNKIVDSDLIGDMKMPYSDGWSGYDGNRELERFTEDLQYLSKVWNEVNSDLGNTKPSDNLLHYVEMYSTGLKDLNEEKEALANWKPENASRDGIFATTKEEIQGRISFIEEQVEQYKNLIALEVEHLKNVKNIDETTKQSIGATITQKANETTVSNPEQTTQLERENTAIEENIAKLKENTQAHEENNNASHIGCNDPIARAMEEEGQTVDKIASEEELALQRLQSALIETARTVDIKTQAFRDEQQTVDGVVQEEITRFEVLSGTILSLASDLEKFTNIPVNIKVEDNGLSEENLDRIKNSLTTIKEQIGDSIILDVKFDEQSLIDFTSKSDNLVTNLDKIVADLKGIVVEINAIDPDILKNLGKATGNKPNVNGNQPKNTGLKDVNISSQEVADIQNRVKREKDFRDVLGDELDIIKQIRSVNGKQYESYRVTGKNGNSITFGRSTKGKNGKWSYNPLNASVSGSDDYTASQASDRLNAQVHKSAGADWRKNVIAEVKTIQTLENQISELNTKTNKNQLAELQRQLTAHQNNLKALEKESSTYQDVVDMTKLAVQKDNERNKLIEKQAQKSTKAFDTEMKAKQDQKAKDQKINQEEYNKLLTETLNKYEAMYKLREKMNSEQDLYKKANLKAEIDETEKAYNSAYGKLSKRKSYSGLFDKSEYEKQRNAIANKYTTRIDNNQKSDTYKEQQNALEWLIKNEQNYQNLIAKRDSTATDEDGNKILKYTADNIQAEEKLSKQIEEKKAIIQGNTEAMEAFNKAEQEAIASAQKWAENKVLDITSKKQKTNESKVSNDNLKKQSDEIKGIFSAINKINNLDMKKFTDETVEKISKAQDLFKDCEGIIKRIQDKELVGDDELQKVKNLKDALEDAFKSAGSDSGKLANANSVEKLVTNMKAYIGRFSGMPKEAKAEIESLINTLENVGKVSKEMASTVGTSFTKVKGDVAEAGQETKSFFDMFTSRVKGMSASALAQYFSLYDIIRYGREAITIIKDLDTAMVDLKKTSSMNDVDFKDFYNNSSDIAQEMGVSTEAIINQASAWSRLGYSTKEQAETMAKVSSQFASISPDMDVDTATDGLVSIMKAFDIDAEDTLDGIASKINIVGNTAATTNGEIVDMLQRSSSAMKEANNTLDETIAIETAAVEVTRSAETTGTAFKTLSMRLRGYDEETESYTGDVEELTGKIADLTKTAKTPGGISLFTDASKTEYKSTYQLLKEISEIYSDLDDKTQAKLLETMAGKRNGQVVGAVLGNWDAVEKALNNMQNSVGSADAEMGIIKDSMDYKINAIKESWIGTLKELSNTDGIKTILDSVLLLSDGLGDLISQIGLLGVALTGLGIYANKKNDGGLVRLVI